MNPNENLQNQIDIARDIMEGNYNKEDIDIYADELAEYVLELNDWIQSGGELPEIWCSAKRKGEIR